MSAEVQRLPWWYRSSVLLSIGAASVVLSLVVALVVRSGRDDGSPTAGRSTAGEGATADAATWDLAWVFNDPNRSLGDGLDSIDTRTAVWALDTGVVVAGVDNVRGHRLETGAQTWQRKVDGHVCSAAAGVPSTSRLVVIGEGKDCSTVTAINARTGRTVWDEKTDDIFVYESIVMARAWWSHRACTA